jgi:hypothetical protein
MVRAANIIRRIAGRRSQGTGTCIPPCVQRPAYRREGNIIPWNVMPGKQPNLKAFRTRGKARRRGIGEAGTEDHLDLVDAGNAEDAQDAVDC